MAVGTQAPRSEPIQRLRSLAQLQVPSRQQAIEAAERLRSAVAGQADRADTLAEWSAQHADLLYQALALHDSHGDQSCPVCGIGVLDSTWALRTRNALEQERSVRAELAAARNALAAARREARTLIDGVSSPAGADGFDLPELPGAVAAFELWSAAPDDDLALADHLVGVIDLLTESYAALQSRAAAMVAEHEDRWAPIALQLARWVDLARKAEAAAPQMTETKRAADWLKANTATLRNQRIAPLADRARHIWATLRQESNVDLGAIRLEGSSDQAPRRAARVRGRRGGRRLGRDEPG